MQVQLFGELRIRIGEQLVEVESSRARSLIGYLLLEPDDVQSRERVAFALWPESTDAQARTNLRKTLHGLRRSSPDFDSLIEVTPRTLRWRRERTDVVDVDAFRAALAAAEAATSGDSRCHALELADHHYHGSLLVDCWDEWVVEHRERCRDQHLSAIRQLADAYATQGELEQAVRVGQEVLLSLIHI